MDYFEYRKVSSFIEEKSLHLMKHEGKDFAHTGFPYQNYEFRKVGHSNIYLAKSNVFKGIMDSTLPRAQHFFKDKFGTGNALDVLDALYNIEPVGDFDFFCEFLSNEQFCYVVQGNNGIFNSDILRIDLFRHLKKDNNNNHEFVGGVFHAFKHFSLKNIPLSTGIENTNIPSPIHLIYLIAHSFYFSHVERKGNVLNCIFPLDNVYCLNFYFYHETNTNVYFLKTAFKERISN